MPLRLEVGPRDFEARQVTVARRDSPPGTKGVGMPVDGLGPKIAELLEQFQADLFNTAKKARDDKLVQVWEWKDFVPALNQNCIVLTPFCNEIEWEEQVKTKSRDEYLNGEAEDERTATSVAAKTLCIPFKQVCRRATAMRRARLLPPPLPSLPLLLDGHDSHARCTHSPSRAKPDLPEGTPCFVSGKPATCWVLWGRSY